MGDSLHRDGARNLGESLALEKVDEPRRAVEQRPHADEPVVAPGERGAHARMRPGPRREPRPHRIEPDIARRVDQMLFVERATLSGRFGETS